MLSILVRALLISNRFTKRCALQCHNLPEYEEMFRQDCHTSEKNFHFLHSEELGVTGAKRNDNDNDNTFDCFSFPGKKSRRFVGVDATAPLPFGATDLARASKYPLFSNEDCAAVVCEAEASLQWRHALRFATYNSDQSPAEFCSIRELPSAKSWLDTQLVSTIFPSISKAFPTVPALAIPGLLRATGAQVVKYNASAGGACGSELGVHRDGPLVACVISLNDVEEYDGGGTFIEALKITDCLGASSGGCSDTNTNLDKDNSSEKATCSSYGVSLRRAVGHMVMHPGYVRHGGAPVTRGVRYILVLWVLSTAYFDACHYANLKASSLLARALQVPRASTSGFRQELLHLAAEEFRYSLKLEEGVGEKDVSRFISPETCRSEAEMAPSSKSETALVGLAQAIIEVHRSVSEKGVVDLQNGTSDSNQIAQAVSLLDQAHERAPTNAHAKSLLAMANQMVY
mmetsp:Transcript_29213/g.59763  ORF Transcript_29213/g.59763 Transcript_29213/m.59763 type:complete len:458 (+) Transcript_29213:67-1440(+)